MEELATLVKALAVIVAGLAIYGLLNLVFALMRTLGICIGAC